jgi:steroid delta-isomerase-like uncharacterized protein
MTTTEQSRTTAQNKDTVREFIDGLFTKGDLGATDAYLAEDFINHDPPFGVPADRDGMRAAGQMMRAGFPDWHSELHDLIAEGDLVVERFTASGTHRGEVMGVPATGRTVSLPGINIFRLREGWIVERWGRLDDLGFLRQLGIQQPGAQEPGALQAGVQQAGAGPA